MSSNFAHLYKSSISLAGSEEVPFLFAPHMLKTKMTPDTNVGNYPPSPQHKHARETSQRVRTHSNIRRSSKWAPLPESVGNVAGGTSSTRTDHKCRERQGTLLPESRYERPMDRDLNKVIGNVQCRRLNEERLILASGIPKY